MSPVETLLAEVLGQWFDCNCPDPTAHRQTCLFAVVAAEQAKALREWLTSGEAIGGVSEWWRRWPGPSDDGPLMHAAVLATLADLIGGAR